MCCIVRYVNQGGVTKPYQKKKKSAVHSTDRHPGLPGLYHHNRRACGLCAVFLNSPCPYSQSLNGDKQEMGTYVLPRWDALASTE